MIPNALQHINCPECMKTVPAGQTLAEHQRLEVAITANAIVIGCSRHKLIIMGFPLGIMVQAIPQGAIPLSRTKGGVLTLPAGAELPKPKLPAA